MYLNLLVQWLQTTLEREEGQDLIEYALLIVFIAVVVVAALGPLGTAVAAVYTWITGQLGITG